MSNTPKTQEAKLPIFVKSIGQFVQEDGQVRAQVKFTNKKPAGLLSAGLGRIEGEVTGSSIFNVDLQAVREAYPIGTDVSNELAFGDEYEVQYDSGTFKFRKIVRKGA